MTVDSFKESLADGASPEGLRAEVRALWHDARGDWEEAHRLVQDGTTSEAAWVHAYLHRKEGDLSNASYWYRRAGKTLFHGTLEDEWEHIVRALL